MKAPQDIIIRPIITEASMAGITDKKYTFEVARNANKIEIGKAVESLFPGTKVLKVNTLSCKGRAKRMGASRGYQPDWKKAIITLKQDSKGIEFFEGMV